MTKALGKTERGFDVGASGCGLCSWLGCGSGSPNTAYSTARRLLFK